MTVEIIDGEDAGKRVVSREDNGFYMIEFVRLNQPFAMRASKTGYFPLVKAHPGIVDDSLGYPSNPHRAFLVDPAAAELTSASRLAC